MTLAKSDRPARIPPEAAPKKQRRGGKPKGYKHGGTQRLLAGSEASDVRRAFLAALNKALPFAAFTQLRSLAPSDVPSWSDRWWIHAPCVLEHAAAIVSMAERRPEPSVDVWKRCRCLDGSRCRHHYSYWFSLYGRPHKGKTGTSSYESAQRAARKQYKAAVKAAGDPPLKWRSPLEQFSDSYRGPTMPPKWRSKLSELNGLKVDARHLDDVLNSPIEPIDEKPDFSVHERQLGEYLKRLEKCGKNGAKVAAGLNSSYGRVGGLQDTTRLRRRLSLLPRPLANLQKRRHLHGSVPHWLGKISKTLDEADALRQLVSDARARALKQSRVRAPIGADPIRESREEFLTRAFNHWNARAVALDDVLLASDQSVTAPAPRPELPRHIDWLIRFQVKGESATEIATNPIALFRPTVSVEIRRLTKLLELKPRPGCPRGRPRKNR